MQEQSQKGSTGLRRKHGTDHDQSHQKATKGAGDIAASVQCCHINVSSLAPMEKLNILCVPAIPALGRWKQEGSWGFLARQSSCSGELQNHLLSPSQKINVVESDGGR